MRLLRTRGQARVARHTLLEASMKGYRAPAFAEGEEPQPHSQGLTTAPQEDGGICCSGGGEPSAAES